MDQSRNETAQKTDPDYRVQITSKRKVLVLINRCKDFLSRILEEQPEVADDMKKGLLEELMANFEAAVQVNVLVNGLSWEDAPDAEEEDEAVHLESLLDDQIVETTRKRRTYPRKILPRVVHTLKAEREIMGLYEQPVRPPESLRDPDRERLMTDVSAGTPVLVRRAIQVIKSINTLLSQTEGLCEVLHMRPNHVSQEVHREVLSSQSEASPPASRAARIRQPIKRAVDETMASEGYVPSTKKLALVRDDGKQGKIQ